VSGLPATELRERLLAWVEDEDAWDSLVRHDSDERVHTLLHRDDDVEVYVVCWMTCHDTGFHDHDESAAAITVLAGSISEERLALGGAVEVALGPGDTVTIAREAIHRVRHSGAAPAVTLHAYSPPLRRVGTYEVAADGALLRHPRPSDVTLAPAAAA
jgi:mannose-6-phosphate isomerase-like protein (cupin superfamily)